jgi:hypothetical protein
MTFWKKRKSFFSEEKKQKTFTSAPLPRYPAMAGIYPRAPGNKSLFTPIL